MVGKGSLKKMGSSLTSSFEKVRSEDAAELPLVTALIVFLNAEKFLEEAIQSVFSQTYPHWELLLVNDGSTDGSSLIARQYQEKFPQQIRYLEHNDHQNHGISASRSLGIQHAQGKYIAFLDADDIWLPEKLDQQVNTLEAHPDAALVYGLYEHWYSWTGETEDAQRDFVLPLGVPENSLLTPPHLFEPFIISQEATIPCPSTVMFRREIIPAIGGYSDHGLGGSYEDQIFYAKVGLIAPVYAANHCWARYRQHPDSICAGVQKEGLEYGVRLAFLTWLADYLSAKGFTNPKIWRGLRKELWRCQHPRLHRFARSIRQKSKRLELVLSRIAYRILPSPLFLGLRGLWLRERVTPPVGWVRLGNLRRLTPLSREFGYDRGLPIDRYYIEDFLSRRNMDIRGRVLEIADDTYTRRFGGEQVTQSDVLHATPGNPVATLVGDLTAADNIPDDYFDCVVLTQTLQVIYNVPAAINTLYRILKPGGVALVTIPGISPVSRYDMERWGYYWSFTTASARRLFEEVFPRECIQVEAYGNVLTSVAFLMGMAVEELRQQEMDTRDPAYELLITIRAVKPAKFT
jgi:glycosyltransferase involved in cell wall biosynthesis/SAM-dependent methyltransferase